ncbi:MAG: GtrA family protein [Candidatus Omnitrophica bacterium]|nr:GtrA family protein [Candidatus Omnitrophota bacterium]
MNFKEIVKFLITGTFVVGVDIGLYSLLIHYLPYAISKGISFSCGGVVAYSLNKYWTFARKRKSKSEVFRFIIANLCALVVNVGINNLILAGNKENVFIALITATFITAVFTYVIFKFWVFKLTVNTLPRQSLWQLSRRR